MINNNLTSASLLALKPLSKITFMYVFLKSFSPFFFQITHMLLSQKPHFKQVHFLRIKPVSEHEPVDHPVSCLILFFPHSFFLSSLSHIHFIFLKTRQQRLYHQHSWQYFPRTKLSNRIVRFQKKKHMFFQISYLLFFFF